MRIKVIFAALFFLCASLLFPYEETKILSLSAEGIDSLEVDCGAGFLSVRGFESLDKIEVTAEILLKGKSERRAKKFIKKNVRLELLKKGNKAVLVSEINQRFLLFSWGSQVINLTVKVPKNINLDIDDGSGSLKIEDISGSVYVDDGSGSIEIESINGSVDIEDDSGGIEVGDVVGSVSIDDGSGSIRVRDVDGDVKISDGSGSINVNGVGGDFILEDDGSGGLRIRNVKGRIIK